MLVNMAVELQKISHFFRCFTIQWPYLFHCVNMQYQFPHIYGKPTVLIYVVLALNCLACVAGGIVGMHEVKFFGGFGGSKGEWRSRNKYCLPGNLGFLHAAHFYHLIELITIKPTN